MTVAVVSLTTIAAFAEIIEQIQRTPKSEVMGAVMSAVMSSATGSAVSEILMRHRVPLLNWRAGSCRRISRLKITGEAQNPFGFCRTRLPAVEQKIKVLESEELKQWGEF